MEKRKERINHEINTLEVLTSNLPKEVSGEDFNKVIDELRGEIEGIYSDIEQFEENKGLEFEKFQTSERKNIVVLKKNYEKLLKNWKEISNSFDSTLLEKEELQKDRDLLLCKTRNDAERLLLIGGASSGKDSLKPFIHGLFNDMLKSIVELVNAERGTIFLFNQPESILESITTYPRLPETIRVPFEKHKSICGHVFLKGRPINIINARKDSRHYQKIDDDLNFTTMSIIAYPLMGAKKTSIGVLELMNKRGGHFTLEDDIRMTHYSALLSRVVEQTLNMNLHPNFVHGSKKSVLETDHISRKVLKSVQSKLVLSEMLPKRDEDMEEISVMKKYANLIPKHVESFIRGLHESFQNAILETAHSQILVKSLREDVEEFNIQNLILKKSVERLKKRNEELLKTRSRDRKRKLSGKFLQKITNSVPNQRKKKKKRRDKSKPLTAPQTPKPVAKLRKMKTMASFEETPAKDRRFEINERISKTRYNSPAKSKLSLFRESFGNVPINYKMENEKEDSRTSSPKVEDIEIMLPKVNKRRKRSKSIPDEKRNVGDIYRKIFQTQSKASCILNHSFRFLHCNNRALRLLLGVKDSRFFDSEDRILGESFSKVAVEFRDEELSSVFDLSSLDGLKIVPLVSKSEVSEERFEKVKQGVVVDVKIKPVHFSGELYKIGNMRKPQIPPLYIVSFRKSVKS